MINSIFGKTIEVTKTKGDIDIILTVTKKETGIKSFTFLTSEEAIRLRDMLNQATI